MFFHRGYIDIVITNRIGMIKIKRTSYLPKAKYLLPSKLQTFKCSIVSTDFVWALKLHSFQTEKSDGVALHQYVSRCFSNVFLMKKGDSLPMCVWIVLYIHIPYGIRFSSHFPLCAKFQLPWIFIGCQHQCEAVRLKHSFMCVEDYSVRSSLHSAIRLICSQLRINHS